MTESCQPSAMCSCLVEWFFLIEAINEIMLLNPQWNLSISHAA